MQQDGLDAWVEAVEVEDVAGSCRVAQAVADVFDPDGPMKDHFHGRSTGAMGPKTPVLGCECGEWGCWPLMADITVTPDHVTWNSFEQPHRTTRDYSGFGPFQFDRRQYDDAVKVLSAAVSSDDT
ncbi:hypothetical protein OG978_43610 (plasmid) [Streptomyces sp. NBC_01591]|uniref:hypothetical protein n=1 Tax=Streptomyces sp. NBC_01591 TaxID=2975888 RepID=UPI002DD9D9C2|nr:hypothetical protein [Streptomyces sp. NBC_01591]WSD74048.1 hypothetical protein OG978_43610 [Streptomyces sp. NBC_01591]